MSGPSTAEYIRYLAAKQGLDDRSLNRQVWEALVQAAHDRPAPLRVLELGCGIGTMLERLLNWGLLTQAAYTGIDLQPEFIQEAEKRCRGYAAAHQAAFIGQAPGALVLRTLGQEVQITFAAADLNAFAARPENHAAWHLLIAHAVLDLLDLDTALPRLLALLTSGGLFYFTLNFDGATILEPPLDPGLDALIETLYHRSMDTRLSGGQPSGGSTTGRRLLSHLNERGAHILAAGSSDWVVFPGPAGYSGDEAFFLHFIINTMAQALNGHPDLDQPRLDTWLAARRRQIDSGRLIYIAHQLDVIGYI